MAARPRALDLVRLVKALRRRKPFRLVVLGDLILDRWIWGDVERISPEAPVPVLDLKGETFSLGGASNVAANLRALGATVEMVGTIGKDAEGERILGLGRDMGVSTSGVLIDESRPTTTKTRVIAHNQQIVRIDREVRGGVPAKMIERLLAFLTRILPDVNAMVLSDYGKGILAESLLDGLRALLKGKKTPIVVDPKNPGFSIYRDFTLLTPNQTEASVGAGIKIKDEATLVEAGFKLRAGLNLGGVLVTRGAQGMSLFERGRDVVHIPTVARNVYDVTGAGDTVAAVMALGLSAGMSLTECAHVANHAAGVVVGKFGTATLTLDELQSAVRG